MAKKLKYAMFLVSLLNTVLLWTIVFYYALSGNKTNGNISPIEIGLAKVREILSPETLMTIKGVSNDPKCEEKKADKKINVDLNSKTNIDVGEKKESFVDKMKGFGENSKTKFFGFLKHVGMNGKPETIDIEKEQSTNKPVKSSIPLVRETDHLPGNYYLSKLSPENKLILDESYKQIMKTVDSSVGSSNDILKAAKMTHWPITPHLLYRYYSSVDWGSKYYGRSIPEAAIDTVLWRAQKGIHSLRTDDLAPLVEARVMYCTQLDKEGRPVLFIKPGMPHKRLKAEEYLRLLLYTIERVDRMAQASGSGEMVAVVDLKGYSMYGGLPVSVITEGVNMLKSHFPYRLHSFYLVNPGMAFSILWKMIQPLLSARTKSKIFMLKKNEMTDRLLDVIGSKALEEEYGGTLVEKINAEKYFADGYWPPVV